MKKKSVLFLYLCLLLYGVLARAEDGITGQWRYEYNDNIILFNFVADGTFEEVISTNDEQGAILAGKYSVSGDKILITECMFNGEARDDFSYTYEVNGDTAMFSDYSCVRVLK